ncbi:thiamine pyrophosphate-requiring protein [Halobellus limi]|uniref:Acetolactate synthase-1/2/3 large subunit n=1 Tax=Halobellus limi TaxID=699433 RepID=A0A1H6A1E1_9EURY|nr:thiamine pyrophosphate-requiring protein [Halobellus limi]QCC47863.1 thiamine pyrophosphate-requiring protein [Halobellus limi]SEG42054.1 acetolactate synthase-1/2/3 large subunit [Halobellus limi]
MTPIDDSTGADERTVAESMLRSLAESGVEYVFSNFGTDHTPLIEAAARLRESGGDDRLPEFVVCPHEFVALSAAHGYAVRTGDPQAVLVHVDVGTQNLGAAMHNAHRANAPVFVIAGLSPVSDAGYPGSRDNPVHYAQDVFDQTSIVEEYCRWTEEYRVPADPNETVRRGLERAASTPSGPVYLTATREALETPSPTEPGDVRPVRRARPAGPDDHALDDVVARLEDAARPLVVTSSGAGPMGDPDLDALVGFAETVGAGVVEHVPHELCFPRDHDLHVGFDPTDPVREADLLVVLESDVPWVPSKTTVPDDLDVVQIDTEPSKAAYPKWPFEIDTTLMTDPAAALRRLAERVGTAGGGDGTFWREMHAEQRAAAERRVEESRAAGRLDAAVLSDAIGDHVDEETVVLQGATTNRVPALEQIPLSEPGSFFWRGGAGLGWAVPAGIGAKLAAPDHRVISLLGDGGYLFSNPAASVLAADNANAPTLSVIYHNEGWEAVRRATRKQHETGAAAAQGVPEGDYGETVDLSRVATIGDAHARRVDDLDSLDEALSEAVAAVDGGQDAVLDVRLDVEG